MNQTTFLFTTALLLIAGLAGCLNAGTEYGDPIIATPEPSIPGSTRFIAWGDTGTGGDGQYATSATALAVCELRGCDAVLTAGDIIYENGVRSLYDSQFEDKFEIPYANWTIPFYHALGNHDNGDGYGTQQVHAEHMIQYTTRPDRMSDKWQLPARQHTFQIGDVQFFALDTNTMVLMGDPAHVNDPNAARQAAWLQESLEASMAPIKIAFGHHPYISNGVHGDAGNYDGIPGFGQLVRDFFDAHVCGKVDLYIAGHDHDLQWLEPGACQGTQLIVSGAGAKTRSLTGNHPALFERGDGLGFFWMEAAVADGLPIVHGVAYDVSGDMLFDHTFSVE